MGFFSWIVWYLWGLEDILDFEKNRFFFYFDFLSFVKGISFYFIPDFLINLCVFVPFNVMLH